jgi:hypothetical protein
MIQSTASAIIEEHAQNEQHDGPHAHHGSPPIARRLQIWAAASASVAFRARNASIASVKSLRARSRSFILRNSLPRLC